MKKNAVLVAGIMFVAAGCASSQGQRASYDSSYDYPSSYDRADVRVSSAEVVERDAQQRAIAPSYVDTSTAVSVDSAAGAPGGTVSHSYSSDVSADSSKRGGSLDARGYHQDANNDEVEAAPDPINPGKQADSSIRGGSLSAREREWNHDSEPSSGLQDSDRHLKADSSIRGGSLEARGAREATGNLESSSDVQTEVDVDVDSGSDLRSSYESESRDDFGQGSSATWESDKASGSVRGSANWNASDDLMRDGLKNESISTAGYELNNDASVGGAGRSESGSGSSSIDQEEVNSEASASGSPGEQQNDSDSSIRIESDLNSSEQLEENISGEFDLEEQKEKAGASGNQPSASLIDANATDSYSSSSTSERSTDIHHDESDLTAIDEGSSAGVEVEAAGAAASAEVGTSSSSELESNASDEFESNDPAMKKPGSPLGTAGGEPNFHYQDNRAHGVGSATSGDFATAPVNRNVDISGESGQSDLAQQVKGRLTRESTGTHGLMRHEVARNIQVSANNDGDVTLTGTVPSEKDKQMIEIRTREIAGVKRVNNQLTVTPEADAAHRDATRGSDLEDVTNELQD